MNETDTNKSFGRTVADYKERRRYAILQAAAILVGKADMGPKDAVLCALSMISEIQNIESGEEASRGIQHA